jgi:hypothetical protein
MTRPDEISAEEIRAYLDSQALPEHPLADVRAYQQAAAVLVAIRNPEHLRPLGTAPAGAATELLGSDLVPATGRKFNGQVMLGPDVRAETIRNLVAVGRIEEALEANPAERDGPLQTQFERYLRQEAPPLAEQTLEELEATWQVSAWLDGVVEGVPAASEVEERTGYFRLLAPFEALAGDAIFRGRRRELDRLRSYIGAVSPESAFERLRARAARWIEPERQPAVSISGIGGAGKSALIARFMLEHTRLPEKERIPFGYLDFARTNLDIGDPLGLCRELLRQLDLQFPGVSSITLSAAPTEHRPAKAWISLEESYQVLSALLNRLRSLLGPRPYVIVLDTFEEVQYRGEERAYPFWELLSELQDEAPFLRVVVAGRAPVGSLRLTDRLPRQIELSDLDDEAAAAFLGTQGIEDPRAQRDLIETFGRLPLSLKLVSSLAARTPGGAAALLAPTTGLLLLAASEEVVQAQLYGRILDHITDERVRRLAHPGLTLRRVNPTLILEVLNEPCGLLIETIEEATALFEELRRESSLVSVDSAEGDLVHRPDLRRVMLKMMLNGAPAVVEQIHRRAVAWYENRDDRRDWAEAVYHRLHLGELIESSELHDREVRASIQAAIEEFPVEVQLWLSALGFEVSAAVRAQASRDQEHASVAAQIEELLPYGSRSETEAVRIFESAYAQLRDDGPGVRAAVRSLFGRADRGASPLFRAGARLAAQRGDDEQALDLIERGLERAAGGGAAGLTLGLLKERAWLYRHRSPAEQAEGLALLNEHARRHQDLPALIQHRSQSLDPSSPSIDDDIAALKELLDQAGTQDLWSLMPALPLAVMLGEVLGRRHFGRGSLIDSLRNLIRAPGSPFEITVFSDPECQSALDDMVRTAYGTVQTESGESPNFLFQQAFLRLCDVWPYRILYVAAPYGRRGEQLTIE